MIEKLYKKDRYIREFERLREKAKENPSLLNKHNLTEEITLRWALLNQNFIIKNIIKTIKKKEYKTPIAKEKEVLIGEKKRLLYGFDWHEKVLQSTISTLLLEELEPIFSNSLNSYRKGRGTHNTLFKLSSYLHKAKDDEKIYVLKKDVKSYGDSIKHDKLFQVIKNTLNIDKDLLEIIKKIIQFKYYEFKTGTLKTKKIGLPTGSAINNVMTNLFLTSLDQKIDEHEENSCYFRYGDDILVATNCKETAKKITNILFNFIKSSSLKFNEEKEIDYEFKKTESKIESFKYLGFLVQPKGTLTLTAEKDEELKLFINNFLKKINKMISTIKLKKEEKIKAIIDATNTLLYKSEIYNLLLSYFPVVSDENYWKNLDLWLAKQILTIVYKKNSGKVFSYYPFKKLRKKGLPSLVHLRRLYLSENKKRFKLYKNY